MKSEEKNVCCSKKSSPIAIIALVICLAAIGSASGRHSTIGAASGTYVGQASNTQSVKKTVSVARFNLPSGANSSQATSIAQVNTDPVLSLVDALVKRGAKVNITENELKGVSVLSINVDGKPITPWVKECPTCAKIVFEY